MEKVLYSIARKEENMWRLKDRSSSIQGVVFAVIVVVVLSSICFGYSGGSGEPNDPYQISDVNDLLELAGTTEDYNKCFILTADINIGGQVFTTGIIAADTNLDIDYQGTAFGGVFDGNNNKITNFIIDGGSNRDWLGLFGRADSNSLIKNLGLDDYSIIGDFFVGGLVGDNRSFNISNCYSIGSVDGGIGVGGLVGVNGGSISNCYSVADVNGNQDVGGLVGTTGGTISNCYVMGSVSGTENIGGLVGRNSGGIWNSYSTSAVTGTSESVGGLAGYHSGNSGVILSSYWDVNSSGQLSSAGGKGKTTEEMQISSTFVGWGCEEVWTIEDGNDYPRLLWEGKPGEIISNFPQYGGGSGEPNDPYLIYTAEQLNMIGEIWCDQDKHFKLMSDIDLGGFSGSSFNVIGSYNLPFAGVFDGNGHTISNFSYILPGANAERYRGFFLYVNSYAEIRNLGLLDPNVDGGAATRVGSLIGHLAGGTVNNCYAEGGNVRGRNEVGGIVGWNGSEGGGGVITNCYSTANITGTDAHAGGVAGLHYGYMSNCYSQSSVSGYNYVGGLTGSNYGLIFECYAMGSVSGRSSIGGFTGSQGSGGEIANCYARGSVSATSSYAGGFIGYADFGEISKCYSTGAVSGSSNVGGLVGRSTSCTVTDSFWDVNSSGKTTSAGGTGKTTAEMQTMSTFTDAGWDFVGEVINGPNDVWRMCVDGVEYPELSWEFNIADFVCPDGVDFIDFAVLANTWLLEVGAPEYKPICDISIPADEIIDMSDLQEFAENWLVDK